MKETGTHTQHHTKGEPMSPDDKEKFIKSLKRLPVDVTIKMLILEKENNKKLREKKQQDIIDLQDTILDLKQKLSEALDQNIELKYKVIKGAECY